jgi:hypothetical protein
MQNYLNWETAVVDALAGALEISHSDVSGMVEAQPFHMQQSWGKGLGAQQTSIKILAAAQTG